MKGNDATIKDLLVRQHELEHQARKLRDAVKALREVCDHESVYDGHGHKDDYYYCRKCGLEWSE